MKRIYYICNLQAGKAELGNYLGSILDQMTKADYEVTVRPTQAVEDAITATTVAVDSGCYDYIFCSGGDGTLHEVLTGMLHAEQTIPVGYIPSGSMNDFAKSMTIPRDMEKACAAVLQGTPRSIDIGTVNDRGFSYVVAFGAFTDVTYETSQAVKNVLGPVAYMFNAVKKISNIRAYPMRITCDGEVIEDEFIYGMVSNSASVGGGILDISDFCFDDGKFEVILVKKQESLAELHKTISFLRDMKEISNEQGIYCLRASDVTIELLEKTNVPWTIDGEYLPNESKFHIVNHKQAVSFLVPETCPMNYFHHAE